MTADTYKEARKGLVNSSFFDTPNYHAQKNRARRDYAHPVILEFERKFIARMKRLNIPMFTVWCWRTGPEQMALYDKGRSKARPGKSPHSYGMAVDIVHSVMAWNLEPKQWEMIGEIGKDVAMKAGMGSDAEFSIEWGGDWTFYDPAHWQIRHWKERMYRKVRGSKGWITEPYLIPAEYVF